MSRKTCLGLLISFLGMMFWSSTAFADSIDITLTATILTGAAGTTITIDASLTNLTGSTIFLNGDAFTTSSSFLTIDGNPFLTNAPLSLGAGASSGPFALFSVVIAPGTLTGTYGSNTFSILGGANGDAFGTIGSTQFSVTVVSPVPEPGTIVLLTSGLLAIGIRYRFRKHDKSVLDRYLDYPNTS